LHLTNKTRFEGVEDSVLHPFKSPNIHNLFQQKDKWAHRRNAKPLTVFAFGKYWAHPRKWEQCVRPDHIGRQKNLSQKGFCGAFSLKKRPPRPQAPPSPNNIPQKFTKKSKISQTKNQNPLYNLEFM